MDKVKRGAEPVNVKLIMRTLFDLQVALAGLAIALYEKEEELGGALPRAAARGGKTKLAAMASAGSENGWVDDDCDQPPPVPEACDSRSLELLCQRLGEIRQYLQTLCKLVRH
jgi:hypothetical protein